ncbi:DNA-methyltransferase [Knoellia sp. LjRoot47]|uniref:DNA-methyltransferase n=1 Tax=Knoellia sp. LjRoot47 TaxID=3342330 RepID=UPI003ECDC120
MSTSLPVEMVHRIDDPHPFECLLAELTGIPGTLSREVEKSLNVVLAQLGPVGDLDREGIAAEFYGRLNQKMGSNKETISALYAECAAAGITFNSPRKRRLEWAINTNNPKGLVSELTSRGVSPEVIRRVMAAIAPVTHAETRQLLLGEATDPTKLRKQPDRDVANDVFNAAAGPLVWSIWKPADLATVFTESPMPFSGVYMNDLRSFKPEMFERRRSLVVRQVQPSPGEAYQDIRGRLTQWIADEFEALDNYGFLALVIEVGVGVEAQAWELASDLPLFAERFREEPLKQMFFRSKDVERETLGHVTKIDEAEAHFELLNEGFTYRDTFVLHDEADQVRRLVLVLQKNRRDETKLPCPGCRSDNIGGNSYPSFGVKSWECANPLCTDRSIYNRGKRYDFRSLLKVEGIEVDGNQISVESVRRWQRDVLPFLSDGEIIDTLLAHYSMRGDVVVLLDTKALASKALGREVRSGEEPDTASHRLDFWDSAFFRRFLPITTPGVGCMPLPTSGVGAKASLGTNQSSWCVLEGDAIDVLSEIPDDTFDRSITSPPYYNAREYSQWPNLYAYMHDMYRIGEQVFRTLKPGGLYVYNIFDYFDNDRVVTFSDMGKKRLLLSALMVDTFRRIGFSYLGSAVWDKGDIQGKRGFNAGNFAPFYQSPFNCWEHVLVVQKPMSGPASGAQRSFLPGINQALRIHPVVKMLRGQNILGHTAPYPSELVTALLAGLPVDSLVLDPFAGSGTTARAAISAGHRAVLIERDSTYADLSRRLTREHAASMAEERTKETLF